MSLETKSVQYNFFQITPKKRSALTSKKIQEHLNEIVKDSGKCLVRQELSNKTVFMHDIQIRNSYFIGTIVSASSRNLSGEVNLDTLVISPLSLGDRGALEKHCTFLIDPTANILVLEKGPITALQLCAYLSHCTGLPKVDISLIINPSEIQKFYAMSTVTKFSVKIAKLTRLQESDKYNSEGTAISQVIESADDTNTDNLRLELSVSPENKKLKKSLNKSKIANFIKDFLSFKETEEVKELKVSGEYLTDDGDAKMTILDLIHARLYFAFEMEVGKHSAIFNISYKYTRLQELYREHRQDVITTYTLDE